MACVPADPSLSEGGMASVLVRYKEGDVASVHLSKGGVVSILARSKEGGVTFEVVVQIGTAGVASVLSVPLKVWPQFLVSLPDSCNQGGLSTIPVIHTEGGGKFCQAQ